MRELNNQLKIVCNPYPKNKSGLMFSIKRLESINIGIVDWQSFPASVYSIR